MAIMIKPYWLMEGGLAYKAEVNSLTSANSACFVENPQYDTVLAMNRSGNCVIKYRNSETGLLAEHEYYGISAQKVPMVWEHDNAWFCVKEGNSKLLLVNAFDSDGAPNAEMRVIHEPFYKENLFTPETEIGNQKIYGFVIDDELLDGFKLEDKSDSLRLIFSQKIYDSINNTTIMDYDKSATFQSLSDSLSVWLKMPVSKEDVFKIIANTRKSYWFKNQRTNGNMSNNMSGQIMASGDLNADGFRDFLIFTGGSRMIPNSLIGYDPVHKEKLWEYPYYEGFIECEIIDIDDDNEPEIIIGTTSSGGRHGANWFELEDPLNRYYCSLLILDKNGKIKQINGEKAHYITGGFSWSTKFCVLPDKRIVFGTDNYINQEQKFLQIFDPANGKIDTLNISFTTLLDLDMIDNELVMLHRKGNQHFKSTYVDLMERDTRSFESETVLKPVSLNNKIYYNSKLFRFMYPLTILDEDFRVIYQNTEPNSCSGLMIRDNIVNVVVDVGNGKTTLYNIKLLKNDSFDLRWIVAWLLLVVGYLVYILTKAFFKIPGKAIEGSYAVLYEIFGILFNWRIFGKTSIYTQPVIASLSRQRFYNTMDDLADSYQEVQTRNLGIVKLHFFLMIIDNEMHIIQRIAHDIKNQVHLVNMKLSETDRDEQSIEESMNVIFEKTVMLSDFSRINLMQKNEINLITLLDTVLIKFSAHSRYNDIIWEPEENSMIIEADENLLQIALLNILENSLRYSPYNTPVNIKAYEKRSKVYVKILNEIDDDNTVKGSGIGLLAAERIIAAHGGEFHFKMNDIAEVEIVFI